MDKKRGVLRERTLWIVITAFLLAVIVLISFTPRVLAGNREAENQRLLGMFVDVFRFVQDNYVDEQKVDPNNLVEGALRGMFESLDDPHTYYLSPEEMRELDDTTTGRFGGVGLIISKVERGVEVVAPIEGTPAYKQGVSAGDLIVAVDGKSVVDLNIDEVLSILRGEPGSTVTMTILRGKSLKFDVQVVRDLIDVPTVRQDMIKGGIGYIRIIQFTPLTPEGVKEALREFANAGYNSLIIDLRGNTGGLLSSGIDVADDFLSKGPIVSTRSRIASENHVFYASSRNTIPPEDLPIVVLIDRGSASAAEILAGALQDTGRATVMGEKSYGKGSVQWVRHIGDAGFKMTIARYYTPLGRSVDKVGITPDIPVETPELTEEEEQALSRILDQELIKDFLSRHPSPTDQDISAFERELQSKDIHLDDRYVRRLVRTELNRTNNNPPVYDLEFDLVLREAVNYLRN
jgi:carboxyl-terminal processing protease